MTRRIRVIIDADVRICDGTGARAEAIAWRDGLVLAVGDAASVRAAAGPEADTWSANGATVTPGFVDVHHHASIVALYGGTVRLVPPRVTDIASLQRVLAEAAAATSGGDGWVVATDWDEGLLAEGRAPTRQELDDAIPDRPVVALHYSCHRAVANSRALEAAGIDASTPDPSGGLIERGRGGVPSGLLLERAMSPIEQRARASLVAVDAEGFFSRLSRHYRALVAAGITRVVDATVPDDLAALYREADRRDLLTIPTVIMPVSTKGYLEAPVDALEGAPTGTRGGALEIGPVKLVFDGAPACAMCLGWWQTGGVMVRTMAMAIRRGSLAPIRTSLSVSPRLGAQLRTGILLYRAGEAEAVLRAACERGFAVATHAIGNEAIDLALAAYEGFGAKLHRAGPPRIEHASFLDASLVARIAAVGAAVVAQPHFLTMPTFEHAASIPGLRNMPLRWLLDAGVTVAGSSDHPVTTFDPLDGIRSAVNRLTRRGEPYEADQCITLDEALEMYTRAAAQVSGAGDRAGTLARGKRADLVVLTGTLDAATLKDARVRATVVGGELLHGELGK